MSNPIPHRTAVAAAALASRHLCPLSVAHQNARDLRRTERQRTFWYGVTAALGDAYPRGMPTDYERAVRRQIDALRFQD